jgi:hypothetical protein
MFNDDDDQDVRAAIAASLVTDQIENRKRKEDEDRRAAEIRARQMKNAEDERLRNMTREERDLEIAIQESLKQAEEDARRQRERSEAERVARQRKEEEDRRTAEILAIRRKEDEDRRAAEILARQKKEAEDKRAADRQAAEIRARQKKEAEDKRAAEVLAIQMKEAEDKRAAEVLAIQMKEAQDRQRKELEDKVVDLSVPAIPPPAKIERGRTDEDEAYLEAIRLSKLESEKIRPPPTPIELFEKAAGKSKQAFRHFLEVPENAGGLIVGAKFKHAIEICSRAGGRCSIRFLEVNNNQPKQTPDAKGNISNKPPPKHTSATKSTKPGCIVIEADTEESINIAEQAVAARIADLFIVAPRREGSVQQQWQSVTRNNNNKVSDKPLTNNILHCANLL